MLPTCFEPTKTFLTVGDTDQNNTALANVWKYSITVGRFEIPATLTGIAEGIYRIAVAIGPGGVATGKQERNQHYELYQFGHIETLN